MTYQKYRLGALTTELWRTHGEQDCKLGSYAQQTEVFDWSIMSA